MLIIDKGVAALFRVIMQMPTNSKVFIHNVDPLGNSAEVFLNYGCKVSATTAFESGFYKYHKIPAKFYGEQKMEIVAHENLDMIKPPELFQYAFSMPEFNDDATPVMGQDVLRQWQVSKTDRDYIAPRHLMGLEALHAAVLPGGFFGAVTPRHWMGKYMKFMKYWRLAAPMVAKIQLPRAAVRRYHETLLGDLTPELLTLPHDEGLQYATEYYPVDPVYTGNWFLLVWQKPVDGEGIRRSNRLAFAVHRYACHVSRLKPMDGNNTGLEEEAVEYCAAAFRKSDWSKLSVRQFSKVVDESQDVYGKEDYSPPPIRSPREMRILKVSEANKPSFTVCETVDQIRKDRLAVHIKLGPPTKLYAYTPAAKAILLDLHYKSGITRDELQRESTTPGYRAKDELTVRLKNHAFADDRDWVLKTLQEAGLRPYLTTSDHNRLIAEERWLSIQLTPIKRVIRTQSSENGEEWEELYEDVDMKATFPEVWNLWEKRARQMKLHVRKFSYDFQFEDIVTQACKQSIMNTNVMGLGKTRETLFSILLRCTEKCLLVIPTRLIGVWQEEIEDTIANYVRLVRRNWMGKLMAADVNVIQWGRDCLKENLRAFNIISYENLARVPKDAAFFKCTVCGFVACSPTGHPDQPCPKCNHGRVGKIKKMNRDAGLRKYREKGGLVIDPRLSTGNIVMMEQQEQVYKKMSTQIIGYDRQWDDNLGQNVKVPVIKESERNPHLKWTFSNILRNRFTLIACDETNYVNNPKAKRSSALNNLTARTRIGLTGTLFRGYPRSTANILNWVFKRSVFPDYRPEGKNLESGVKKFERKYATYVQREGKQPKLVPKINQPELFQQEIAPLTIRHLRHEPNVAKDVPPRTPIIENKIIEMEPQHRAYYQRWLDAFAEWWRLKRLEEDKQENAQVVNDLLVKIGYLINASSIPHFMLDNLEGGDGAQWASVIGRYESKELTAKFKKTTEMIKKNVANGDKTMVGCSRVKNLILGKAWCTKEKIHSLKIDGTVSNEIKAGVNRSAKQLIVDKFRHNDYHVMWAGIHTMKEGFNIPEANHAILMDWTWEPADTEQFIARMLRPAQKKTVHATFMCHKGTADEYMAALVQLKWRSAREGVDYESFSDFNADMIPDFKQYANSIVDGTSDELRTKMWTDLERLRREAEDDDAEGEVQDIERANGEGKPGKGDDNSPPPFDNNEGDFEDGDDWKRPK